MSAVQVWGLVVELLKTLQGLAAARSRIPQHIVNSSKGVQEATAAFDEKLEEAYRRIKTVTNPVPVMCSSYAECKEVLLTLEVSGAD